MIDNELTIKKLGFIPSKFSKIQIVVKCDICRKIFEKESIKIYTARKNSKSDVDVCKNNTCVKSKRETTMFNKYGVKNAGLSDVFREKAKRTCVSKYGVPNAMQSEIVKNKSKDSLIQKYGVDNIFKSEEFKKEVKDKNLKKFGVEYYSQTKEYKEKYKNTCVKKYGVDHPMKNLEVLDKSKRTNLKKYGVDWYLQSDDIKEKTKNFYIKNHGVNSLSETEKHKQSVRKKAFDRIYESIVNGNRLGGRYIPLFKKEDYIGVSEKYKFKCNQCSNEFFDNLDNGSLPECKTCFPDIPQNKSQMELEIYDYLSSELKIKNIIKNHKLKELSGKELDIYIPSKNIAIECNGNYFHSELSGNKNKTYHIKKTKICESAGIHLVQIFEDEWIYKTDIVKERLRSILSSPKNIIRANRCKVNYISKNVADEFCEKHHLQGKTISKISIGLFHKNELISVMTFGHERLALGNKNKNINEYELVRYVTKEIVTGGFNKILKRFIIDYDVKKIISYADRRWTNSFKNVYISSGFKFKKFTTPNYWYVSKKKYLQRFHRFSFRKSELIKKFSFFEKSLTEWGNMQLNGYDRLWDCGNLKYELNL